MKPQFEGTPVAPDPRDIMRRVSHRITKQVAERYGDSIPFFYVSEYPKSGGSWLGKMLADCLQAAYPQHSLFPIGMRAVLHNHWLCNSKLSRVAYVYRDGRDIMVSYYFYRMRNIRRKFSPIDTELGRVYERLFGAGYDPDDAVGNLPRFIEHEFRNPRQTPVTWPQHINSWFERRQDPDVAFVSYEQLLDDCTGAVSRVLETISDAPVDPWRIDLAVDKYSMVRQTGRAPGEEIRGTFIRKGVAGDWKNHFSPEAAQIFDDLAGDTLVALGYEPDRSWVGRVEKPNAVTQSSAPLPEWRVDKR